MKIKKIIIEDIGPYKNKEFIFEHPFSLIIDKNEAGKSLIAKSILEALYPTKTPIIPLENGQITLEIESDRDFYKIIRNRNEYSIFKNGVPQKHETKTKGRIIKKSPGEFILNLTRSVFLNTSFLMQKSGLNNKELYPITSFLEHAIDTGFQDTSAFLALARIKEALTESIYSINTGKLFPFTAKGKIDTAIKTWGNELSKAKEEKIRLSSLIDKQYEIIKNYNQLKGELESIELKIREIESSYALWKIQKDEYYHKTIKTLEKRNEELKKLEKLIDFFKNFENLNTEEQQFVIFYENEVENLKKSLILKKQQENNLKKLLRGTYILNTIIAFLSILAGFIDKTFFFGVTICIPVFLYQFKLKNEQKKLNQEIRDYELKSESIYDQIQQIISKFNISGNNISEFLNIFKEMNIHKNEIKELIENKKQIEELKNQLLSENELRFYKDKITDKNRALNDKDIENYEQRREELLKAKEEIKNKIHKLQREYDEIDRYRKRIEEINEQIETAGRYLEALERFRNALQKSYEILFDITEKHHTVWAKKLNESASQLISNITGKEIEIFFDKNLEFNIKVPEFSYLLSSKEIEHKLSGGMAEQIYLTVRLILAQALSKDKKIPLILDEPFAHSDDERFIKGMKYLIQKIARSNQVIVMSCHQNRLKLLEELQGSFNLISVNN